MNSDFARRFRRNKGAVIGLFVLLVVGLLALLAPLVAAHDPWDMVQQPFLAPMVEPGLWLGTDALGRDVAAGLIHGARVSIIIGLVATAAALLAGITVGALAGYHGGWVDTVLMRFTELFQAIPGFAFAVVLVAIFQPSVQSIVAAIALVSWPPVARLVRSEFMSLRQRSLCRPPCWRGRPTHASFSPRSCPTPSHPSW